VIAFTVTEDRIVEIDVIGDPDRVAMLAAFVLTTARRQDS
jgi:hypothetical protein